jgi:hypothetical protein
MVIPLPDWLLFAQQPFLLRQASDYLKATKSRVDYQGVAIVIAVVLGVAALVWLLRVCSTLREEKTLCSARRLWRELCRAHLLSFSDARLLWQIAKATTGDEPCQIFVDRRHFASALQLRQFSRLQRQLESLANRLHGAV